MDMKNVMGMINLNETEEQLRELTRHRPVAAIPFAGRYRLIDFALSNMVNSKIWTIGILAPSKFGPLIDHLRSGKEWDLDRKSDGLFVLPSAYDHTHEMASKRDLENFYQNLGFINSCKQKYVVIAPSRMVCNISWEKVVSQHVESGADVTMVYKKQPHDYSYFEGCTILDVDDSKKVRDLVIKPKNVLWHNVSMEMYVMEKKLLLDLIDACVSRGMFDMVRDGFLRNLDKYNIMGYEHTGYLGRIHSVNSYFEHNMDLLGAHAWQDLFFKNGLIYTKTKDEAPAKYNNFAKMHNSLIANGCIIQGTVEDSVLFRSVKVGKGAVIKNSIIMQKCVIEEGAVLENVICDKEAHITAGKSLKGEVGYPVVVEKRVRI